MSRIRSLLFLALSASVVARRPVRSGRTADAHQWGVPAGPPEHGAYPPGPPSNEVRTALISVRSNAVAGFEAITGRLGDATHPPGPCFTT
jgi:hypothetical protein